jgi:hypothetical protein
LKMSLETMTGKTKSSLASLSMLSTRKMKINKLPRSRTFLLFLQWVSEA